MSSREKFRFRISGACRRRLWLCRHGRLDRWPGTLRHGPYADFNLLKFPGRDKAMARILDLTMLTDILPTGFHGAVRAGVLAPHGLLKSA